MNRFFYAAFLTILMLNAKLLSLDITGVWEISGDTIINENIHVLPGGIIRPAYGIDIKLTVNGGIFNEGDLNDNLSYDNGAGYMDIDVTEDIANSGDISNRSIKLIGNLPQSIFTTSTTPVRTDTLRINNSYPVKALSDLHFMNCDIIFSGMGGFDLSNGYDIYINGGFLSGASVYGPEHYTKSQTKINLVNEAYVSNILLYRVDTDGAFLISGDNCVLNGPLTNLGNIRPLNSYITTILTSTADFTNLGTVEGDILFCAYGDLTNKGQLLNSTLVFGGTELQHITNEGCPIGVNLIQSANPQGVMLLSDLRIFRSSFFITNTCIDFIDNPLILNSYNLYLENTNINNTVIIGSLEDVIPSSSIIATISSSTIAIWHSSIKDVNFYGRFYITQDVIFEGIIHNYADIAPTGCYTSLTINGNLINSVNSIEDSGIISDGIFGGQLTAYVKGNIHNSSVWDNNSIVFCGSGDQLISCDPDKSYSATTVECTNPNGIKAASDLYFTGSGLELTGHALDLNGYDLNMSGGYLDSVVVLSTDSVSRSLFRPSNGSYIRSSIINSVDLDSALIVQGNNVILNGPLTNYGTIMNESTGNSEITLNNQFTNHGTIQDNGPVYKLSANIIGDITNYGTWNNNYNYFNGESDQVILLPGGTEIAGGKNYFVAESDTSPYEWFLNGSTLVDHPYFDGTKEKYLMWGLPVSTAYSGIFYCETGEGTSRNIFVYENGLPAPFITGFTIEDGSTKVGIEWDPVDYAVSYKIYSSDDPYKDLSLWQFEAETNLLHHTLWDQTGGRRFYIVKAVY